MNRNVYVSARVVLQKFTPGNIIERIYIGKQISYKSVIFGKCSRFSFYKKKEIIFGHFADVQKFYFTRKILLVYVNECVAAFEL